MFNKLVIISIVLVSFKVIVTSCWRRTFNQPFSAPSTSSSFGLPGYQRISGRGKTLVDEQGRERIFHGFNSVKKGFPWYDDEMLNVTRLRYYQDWGFNVVRLGTMWSGAQPERKSFNDTYINKLKTIMGQLAEHGMYTIMDMHQDILTSKYNSYDGLPRWLIDSYPEPPHAFPWPINDTLSGGDFRGYVTEAVSEGFQYFYDDYADSRKLFGNFWKKMATVFKSEKHVLGYELINEPWAGDIYKNPDLFIPGIAGERNLVPLYEETHTAIRSVDNNTLVFFEPVTWGVLTSGDVAGSGFSSVPGGAAYRNRSVLSFHYYCLILGLGSDITTNMTETQKLICDEVLGPLIFNAIDDDTNNLQCPSFLTEFGNCSPDANPSSVNTLECNFVMNLADNRRQSWTYWYSENFWDDDGNVNWPTVKAFCRAYPRATAGRLQSYSFDRKSAEFKMTYVVDTTISAPTEVFIPKLHYPQGPIVITSQGLSWTFDEITSTLKIQADSNMASDAVGEIYVLPR